MTKDLCHLCNLKVNTLGTPCNGVKHYIVSILYPNINIIDLEAL